MTNERRHFGTVVASRAVSGPGCNWETYLTTHDFLTRPSSDWWQSWKSGRTFDTSEEAKNYLIAQGISPEDIQERW